MSNFSLNVVGLTKIFGRRLIFKNINLSFNAHEIVGISGPNGSGKSTLVKILAGLLSPTQGNVEHLFNGKKVEMENLHNHVGFVSPYLVLYDEFSAQENIHFFSKIRGINLDQEKLDSLFTKFGLYERKNDLLKTYSSGMKQRVKFIFSMIHKPVIVILDEPTENLDVEGKEKVYEIISELGKQCLILIASNEESDLAICSRIINLKEYKK